VTSRVAGLLPNSIVKERGSRLELLSLAMTFEATLTITIAETDSALAERKPLVPPLSSMNVPYAKQPIDDNAS
jgi:hypothetical protein